MGTEISIIIDLPPDHPAVNALFEAIQNVATITGDVNRAGVASQKNDCRYTAEMVNARIKRRAKLKDSLK